MHVFQFFHRCVLVEFFTFVERNLAFLVKEDFDGGEVIGVSADVSIINKVIATDSKACLAWFVFMRTKVTYKTWVCDLYMFWCTILCNNKHYICINYASFQTLHKSGQLISQKLLINVCCCRVCDKVTLFQFLSCVCFNDILQ